VGVNPADSSTQELADKPRSIRLKRRLAPSGQDVEGMGTT